MSREPVLAAITAEVVAGLALLVAFGVDFTPAQTGAIVGFVTATYGIAVLVRSVVKPTGKE